MQISPTMMRKIQLKDAVEELTQEDLTKPFVIPTETVYGLAACCNNDTALRSIFEIKGRPSDNPLIVHISSEDMLNKYIEGPVRREYKQLMSCFWPGPLTLIFTASSNVSPVLQGGSRGTVAVRMPLGKDLRRLIEHIGVPLAAPSANTSGRPSPTRIEHVVSDLGERVDVYIDGGPCEVGLESTVFGYCNGTPTILRPGAISKEQIENVLGIPVSVDLDDEKAVPVCPGQKYKHYSPSVPVYLFKEKDWKSRMKSKITELNKGTVGILSTSDINLLGGNCKVIQYHWGTTPEECSRNLFAGLRALDGKCDVIFTHSIPTDGIGCAVMDRLRKAATYTVE